MPEERVPHLEASLHPELVMGEDAESRGLLAQPTAVATDGDGNIYVADDQLLTVKKYGTDGSYLTSIGREGNGPGEFRRIRDVFVNAAGQLVVVGTRKVVHFTLGGEHLRTQPLDRSAKSAALLPNGNYLFLGHTFEVADSLLHVYDATRLERAAEFMSSEALIAAGNLVEETTFANRPGNAAVNPHDASVIYAPYLYEGHLYRYAFAEAKPRRTGVLKGRVRKPVYTKVVARSIDRDAFEARMTFAGERDRGVTYHSTSRGLFALERGRLAHFTAVDADDVRVLGVEVFDGSRLAGYASLDTVALDAHGVPTDAFPRIAHRDAEGRFYFVWPGWYNQVPRVQRVTLDFGLE